MALEHGRRLVGDQQVRLGCERGPEQRWLTFAVRQFGGIGAGDPGRIGRLHRGEKSKHRSVDRLVGNAGRAGQALDRDHAADMSMPSACVATGKWGYGLIGRADRIWQDW